jgi:GMP reductase
MPRIDNDIKLDFKDVLIRPKRSTLKSRADVDLTREFLFRHSKKTYEGIPIIASNMDTVGTFEMAIQLSKVCRKEIVEFVYDCFFLVEIIYNHS